MIRSLTGRDGIRVARFNGDTWIVAGESERIASLEAQVTSLSNRLGAINVPPNLSDTLAELLEKILTTQKTTSEKIGDLVSNAVSHGLATVDFGAFPGATEKVATITVTGLQATHAIMAWPAVLATADHTVTDVYLEELQCEVESVAAGSFSLLVRPRVGLAFGKFQFNYLYL